MNRQEYVNAVWNLNGNYWDEMLMSCPAWVVEEQAWNDWVAMQLGL